MRGKRQLLLTGGRHALEWQWRWPTAMSPRCLSILCLLLVCPVVTMLAAPQTPRLAGEVRTKDGPLAGARVRFQGDATSVITDNKGSFLLPVVEKRQRITAWKDGFFIAGAAHDADPLRLTQR